jgi:hypothetical protein
MYKTEIGEFKGSKTMSIFIDDRRVISFGLNKAKAIIATIDHIRDFVENSKSSSIDLDSLTDEQKKIIQQFINS